MKEKNYNNSFSFSTSQKLPPTSIEKEVFAYANVDYYLKVNSNGIIEYVNHNFCKLAGYNTHELIGEDFETILQPHTPNAIYNRHLELLSTHSSAKMIAKLTTKNADYFWLILEYVKNTENDFEFYIHGRNVPEKVTLELNGLFKILATIENKADDLHASVNYLIGFLEDLDTTYDEYIQKLFQSPEIEMWGESIKEDAVTPQKIKKSEISDIDLFKNF